jgi:hypothetical protein
MFTTEIGYYKYMFLKLVLVGKQNVHSYEPSTPVLLLGCI